MARLVGVRSDRGRPITLVGVRSHRGHPIARVVVVRSLRDRQRPAGWRDRAPASVQGRVRLHTPRFAPEVVEHERPVGGNTRVVHRQSRSVALISVESVVADAAAPGHGERELERQRGGQQHGARPSQTKRARPWRNQPNKTYSRASRDIGVRTRRVEPDVDSAHRPVIVALLVMHRGIRDDRVTAARGRRLRAGTACGRCSGVPRDRRVPRGGRRSIACRRGDRTARRAP
jgi:hypothetical protein